MIKIKEIDGFKYIGNPPVEIEMACEHLVPTNNYRKNMTYMRLNFSNWETDREMLSFIGEHVQSISGIREWIDEGYASGNFDLSKDVHLVIRQDDDNPELYGNEHAVLSSSKPKGINKLISKQREYYQRVEEDIDSQMMRRLEYMRSKRQ